MAWVLLLNSEDNKYIPIKKLFGVSNIGITNIGITKCQTYADNIIYFIDNKDIIEELQIEKLDKVHYSFKCKEYDQVFKCIKIFIVYYNSNDILLEEEDQTEFVIRDKYKDIYNFDEYNLFTKNYVYSWHMIYEAIKRGLYRKPRFIGTLFSWIDVGNILSDTSKKRLAN